jgi:epoxide hydrolase-like predicted phosphatase
VSDSQTQLAAALFDLGGVFTESPFAAAERVANEIGAEPGHMLELVFGPYHRDTDHPWHRLERGELSLDDARTEIITLGEAAGVDSDPFRVLALLASGAGPRPAMVARVRSLRACGVRTAIVTNNAREFRDAWMSLLPFEELFDALVDSSELGIRKPDARIFHHALSELGGIAPQHAVFLDDFSANVEAARELGMRGIVVADDPSEALAELDVLIEALRT